MIYNVDVKEGRRERFVEFFEQKGFKVNDLFTRESIVNSKMPVTLDFEKKLIGRVGNVTCACVALKHGMITSEEDFMDLFQKVGE